MRSLAPCSSEVIQNALDGFWWGNEWRSRGPFASSMSKPKGVKMITKTHCEMRVSVENLFDNETE